jgi:arabinofuranan 3-O-arabinosyltransferase
LQSRLGTGADSPQRNKRTRMVTPAVDPFAAAASELRQGSPVAMALWMAAALVAVVDAYSYYRRGIFGLDFEPAWAAANALLHGRTHWKSFVYLPGCLVFVFPLAALPLRFARIIVFVLQFVGVAYTFWVMTRMVKLSLGSARVAGIALGLTFAGQIGIATNYENLTLLLLPFAAAFFVAVNRKQFLVASVVLGISITIKPLLVMLLVVLIARRLWKETTIAIAIPVVLTALVLALAFDPSQFVHEVTTTFANHNAVSPVNVSLSGVLGYEHTPRLAILLVRLLVALASAGTAWFVYRHPVETRGEQAIWLTTPLSVGLYLCFTFSWAYYAILLLPLVFVVVKTLERATWMVLVGIGAALLFPVLVDTLPGSFPSPHIGDWIAAVGLVVMLGGVWLHAADTRRRLLGSSDLSVASAGNQQERMVGLQKARPTLAWKTPITGKLSVMCQRRVVGSPLITD